MTRTDEHVEREFKQAYTTLVAASPLALDWDEASTRPAPLSQQPKASRWRRPLFAFSSAAALVLVALAVVALRPTTATVLETGAADQWRAILFLAGDVRQDQIDSIAATLQDVEGVIRWEYVDQSAALDEALILFANDERNIAIIREDPSILPASLRFATIDEASAQTVEQKALELANAGETAIAFTAVGRGDLVATEPLDLTEQDQPPNDS